LAGIRSPVAQYFFGIWKLNLWNWQNSMSKDLEDFYSNALDIYHPPGNYVSHEITTGEINVIRERRDKLSDQQKRWNRQLGDQFRDKNSSLYKCYHKEYSWSHESPGKNTKYTVDSIGI
jgi:hypothetical protein